MVGSKITNACLTILNDGYSIAALNNTNIVLIPKKKESEQVADYWPISLCNMMYKIVTKTIANRMKGVLSKLISFHQSTFFLGHLILDNVIATFELLNTLGKKNNGRKGFMALNLDISKAYDRVELGLVSKVMERMGFLPYRIGLVLDCISTSQFAFCLNGTVQGMVILSKGIW